MIASHDHSSTQTLVSHLVLNHDVLLTVVSVLRNRLPCTKLKQASSSLTACKDHYTRQQSIHLEYDEQQQEVHGKSQHSSGKLISASTDCRQHRQERC